MGRVVIACYKPKPNKNDALRTLMKDHLAILKSQDLVTDRASIIMETQDGTIVEVFEWKSKELMESAHTNPVVQAMWQRYAEVCDYVPIADVAEAHQVFSEFTPLSW